MKIEAGSFSETIGAVIVGVGKCADPNLPELDAVTGEAHRLRDVLVQPTACRIPDSQVLCLTGSEGTRERVLAALAERAAATGRDGILFFYFAGHGIGNETSFALVPSDGIASRAETLITASDLGRCLAGTAARGIFMVADCCGGAAIYENARALFGEAGDHFEYRILLSSSKRGESSWEIRGKGSPFTAALIEALQGKMPDIGKQGEIYFTSLMAHVTSRVAELLEGQYSDLPPQHPNFDGSYEKDPLLFVNSDIALGQLVLKTARYSPQYVRRRVGLMLGGVVALLGILVTGYWTWIDQHSFFSLTGNSVTLYHGYPGFPWPGMPRQVWQPNLYRDLIRSDSQLAMGRQLIFSKNLDPVSALDILGPSLTTAGKIMLAQQQGNVTAARQLEKTAIDAGDPTINKADVLNLYAGSGELTEADKVMFESIIKDDSIGQSAAAVFPAFLQADPDRAISAVQNSPNRRNPNLLLGLATIRPPCSVHTLTYLSSLARGDQAYLVDFGVNASIQAQCKESAFLPLSNVMSRGKALGYFALSQSAAYRARTLDRMVKKIKQVGAAGWKVNDDNNVVGADVTTAQMWAWQLALSGAGPCDMTLLSAMNGALPDTQLDIAEYLLNSCSNLSFEIVPQQGFSDVEILLMDGQDTKAEILMNADESEALRDRALDFVQRRASIAQCPSLIDGPIESYIKARNSFASPQQDVEKVINSLQWAVQLKYWSPTLGLLLNDPSQSQRIRKWALFAALRANPAVGTKVLLDRISDFSFDYDGFLIAVAFADLPPEAISALRNWANQRDEHDLFRVTLTTLFGTPAEALRLLTSIVIADRATAFNFVEFRNDVPELVAAGAQAASPFDVEGRELLAKYGSAWTQTNTWLAGIPDWALDWRIAISGQLYSNLSGHKLRLLAAINTRKSRGIERPFMDALVRSLSW